MSCITMLSVHWLVALLKKRAPWPEKYTYSLSPGMIG